MHMIIDEKKFLHILDEKNIKYELYNHPPFKTVEDSIHTRGKIQDSHIKNLFLKNKKNIKLTINFINKICSNREYVKKI